MTLEHQNMSTDVASTIAESLKETDELPRKQIAEIVEVLGADVALGLLAETRKVQEAGGLDVRDGTRKRSDGGVFFSLAKARLPKTDRNRIFRIRPPKPEGAPPSEPPAPSPRNGAHAAPVPRTPAPAVSAAREVAGPGGALGRRRVVEVEILRHKPGVAPAPVALPREPEPTVRREEPRAPVVEARPVRRIITVAAPQREEPPATPDAAKERVRAILKGLGTADQRRVLQDLLHEAGVAVEPGRVRTGREGVREEEATGVDDKLRERVLVSVTEALGLSSGDLARVLFGEETPGTRSKARLAIERWRKA